MPSTAVHYPSILGKMVRPKDNQHLCSRDRQKRGGPQTAVSGHQYPHQRTEVPGYLLLHPMERSGLMLTKCSRKINGYLTQNTGQTTRKGTSQQKSRLVGPGAPLELLKLKTGSSGSCGSGLERTYERSCGQKGNWKAGG